MSDNLADVKQGSKNHFQLRLLDGGILVVAFDYAGRQANVLDAESLMQFGEIVQHIKENPKVRGVVLVSLKHGIFIAGADIEKIYQAQKNLNTERLDLLISGTHDLLYDVENSSKPFVAAIEGACMGGGLEVALACHARVASANEKTVFALPEVLLGIMPGFGGTFRLPNLVGLSAALSIIVTGKSVYPRAALRMGLIDALVESVAAKEKTIDSVINETYVKTAIQKVSQIIKQGKIQQKLNPLNRLFFNSPFRNLIYWKVKREIKKRVKNFYPAPFMALAIVKRGYNSQNLNYWTAKHIEKPAFMSLVCSKVSSGLIKTYIAGEKLKRKIDIRNISMNATVGVIGAGAMGSLIAAILSEKGCGVALKDISRAILGRAMQIIAKTEDEYLKKRIIKQSEYNERLLRVYPTVSFKDLANTEIVIEAAVENLSVKQSLLAEFENTASKNAVFATNTSSFTVAKIAERAQRKNRVGGMHFFNPPTKMKLVEIVRAKETSEITVQKMFALARRLDKIPVVVNDGPGFLVNRIIVRYLAEAVILVCEGNSISRVDAVAKNFGMAIDSGRAMGPLKLIDYIKAPVAVKVLESLKALGPRVECRELMRDMVPDGASPITFWRGREENPEIYYLVNKRNHAEIESSDEEILKRLMYPMVDEAWRCLKDAIVENEDTIDVAMIYGVGFPAFRGGLMAWARDEGQNKICDELEKLTVKYGERFLTAGK